jgi:hypothetical protein
MGSGLGEFVGLSRRVTNEHMLNLRKRVAV